VPAPADTQLCDSGENLVYCHDSLPDNDDADVDSPLGVSENGLAEIVDDNGFNGYF
jgi:hypothetical protein